MKITISGLSMVKEGGRLKAYADVIVEGSLLIKGLRVVQGTGRLFIAFPNERSRMGRYHDIVHPLNPQMRKAFEDVVIQAYNTKTETERG